MNANLGLGIHNVRYAWLVGITVILSIVGVMKSEVFFASQLAISFLTVFGALHFKDDLETSKTKLYGAQVRGLGYYLKSAGIYVLSAMVLGIVWFLNSGLGLISFLIISSVHFAEALRGKLDWRAMAFGGTPIFLTCLCHHQEACQIFDVVTSPHQFSGLTFASAVLNVICIGWLLAFIAAMVDGLINALKGDSSLYPILNTQMITAVATLFLSPIPFLALFLIGYHSRRELAEDPAVNRSTVVFLIALSVALALAVEAVSLVNHLEVTNSFVRAFFIALACLSLPHTAIHLDWSGQPSKSRSELFELREVS